MTVNKAELDVTADNISRQYGDDCAYTLTYKGFKNNETAAELVKQPQIETTAEVNSNIGIYTLTPKNAISPNYDFIYHAGELTVTPSPLEITAQDASRLYGDENPEFRIVYLGFKCGETESVLGSQPYATSVGKDAQVGTYPINIVGGNALNYAITYKNGTLTINPSQLKVSVLPISREYGDKNPVATFTYTGLKNNEKAPILTEPITVAYNATEMSPVGEYSVIPQGGKSRNYELSYEPATLTITPASLNIKADNQIRIYGDENEFSYSYSGFKNGETEAVLSKLPKAETTASTASVVGRYEVMPYGADAVNYAISYTPGWLEITKAPLYVIPQNAQREYGDENPVFNLVYNGFKNDDSVDAISKAPEVTSAPVSARCGEYAIVATGGEALNYNLDCTATGILTIVKAPLTITTQPVTRKYGEENPEFSFKYDGLKLNEKAPVFNAPVLAYTPATINSPVGEYPVNLQGGDAENYALSLVPGIMNIEKAEYYFNWYECPEFLGLGEVAELGIEYANLDGITPIFDFNPDIIMIMASGNDYPSYSVKGMSEGKTDLTISLPETRNYLASESLTKTIFVNNSEIEAVNADEFYEVYNLLGIKVLATTDRNDLNRLERGLYIVNGRKVLIK